MCSSVSDSHIGQGHAPGPGRIAVDEHLPGLPARPLADASQLAADFEKRVRDAQRAQGLDAVIDREALGNAREIERDAPGLQQRAIGGIESQPRPADALSRPGQGIRGGQGVFGAGFRTEAPAGNQRADGRIDRTAAGRRPPGRASQHGGELRRQDVARPGLGAVDPADVRIGFPVAHLRDHAVERRFDGQAHFRQRQHPRVVETQRPGGAHGLAAQLLQRRGIGRAGDGRVGVAASAPGAERKAQGGGPLCRGLRASLRGWPRSSGDVPWPAAPWSCCPWCWRRASTCPRPARSR